MGRSKNEVGIGAPTIVSTTQLFENFAKSYTKHAITEDYCLIVLAQWWDLGITLFYFDCETLMTLSSAKVGAGRMALAPKRRSSDLHRDDSWVHRSPPWNTDNQEIATQFRAIPILLQ